MERRAAYVALIAVGLALLAKPVATDLYEAWRARRSISVIEETYDAMADEECAALLEDAEAYDRALLRGGRMDGIAPYADQLGWNQSDMMAHISIPALSLDLPVYHGTDENVLMTGVGHLEGTALPVGTVGGRCVLAGHSGMPNARMFDDVHLLGPGDRFVVWTLGRAFAYEVCESKVVLPSQTEELDPVPGEDLVTLVTCTPYGVNTHRLLVTGRRTEYVEGEEAIPEVETYVNRRTVPLAAGLALVAAVGAAGLHARCRTTGREAADASRA